MVEVVSAVSVGVGAVAGALTTYLKMRRNGHNGLCRDHGVLLQRLHEGDTHFDSMQRTLAAQAKTLGQVEVAIGRLETKLDILAGYNKP